MKTCFFVVIFRLFLELLTVQAGKSAFCMLAVKPPLETLQFLEELAQDTLDLDFDVYLLIDNEKYNFSSLNLSSHVRLVNISVEECVSYGYQYTTHYGKNTSHVTGWDKALLYFTLLNPKYSFVWFVENDVFIPNTRAVRSLHQLYSNESDLIIPSNMLNPDGNATFWQWSEAVGKLIPPWSGSMVNYVGLSQRLLQALYDYVQWRGRSAFHEYFFLTTAIERNLTIVTPTELRTVRHREYVRWKDVYKRPNNIWHPMKDVMQRTHFRKRLIEANLRRASIDYVNDFKKLQDEQANMTALIENLSSLLEKFDVSKGLLSPQDRRFMRRHFLNLSEQYLQLKDGTRAISLVEQLADHAYKLPESPVSLSAPKSSYHLKLEDDLRENKRAIFQLLAKNRNDPLLKNLREQTTKIMRTLTREVQHQAIEHRAKVVENREPVAVFFISSSGYKYSLSFEEFTFQTVLCIQLIPCLSIVVLLLLLRKLAKMHLK